MQDAALLLSHRRGARQHRMIPMIMMRIAEPEICTEFFYFILENKKRGVSFLMCVDRVYSSATTSSIGHPGPGKQKPLIGGLVHQTPACWSENRPKRIVMGEKMEGGGNGEKKKESVSGVVLRLKTQRCFIQLHARIRYEERNP